MVLESKFRPYYINPMAWEKWLPSSLLAALEKQSTPCRVGYHPKYKWFLFVLDKNHFIKEYYIESLMNLDEKDPAYKQLFHELFYDLPETTSIA